MAISLCCACEMIHGSYPEAEVSRLGSAEMPFDVCYTMLGVLSD